jgi:hypothetical protein
VSSVFETETLEAQLDHDLGGLSARVADESFCAELYRALTNNTLSRVGRPHTRLVLSWDRAAEFVNQLRARGNQDPLPLAGSGGEGVTSQLVLDELSAHGWHTRSFGD